MLIAFDTAPNSARLARRRGFARTSPSVRARRRARSASLFREKAERLIDEGVGVLEDAAVTRNREDAELRAGKGYVHRD